MYAMNTCEQQFEYFNHTMSTLIDEHLPQNLSSKSHTNDKPWITESFKELIRKRQIALKLNDNDQYTKLRNLINRQNKTLRKNFYESEIGKLSDGDSKQWWKQIKQLVGTTKAQPNNDLSTMANSIANGDINILANKINNFVHQYLLTFPRFYQTTDSYK